MINKRIPEVIHSLSTVSEIGILL